MHDAGCSVVVARARRLLIVLLLWPCGVLAAGPADSVPTPRARPPVNIAAALAAYRLQMEAYTAARAAYEAIAAPYWTAIEEKRKARNAKRASGQPILLADYVLTQPPAYAGPPRPVDPLARPEEAPPRKAIPVVADFLQAAADHFQFVPQRPRDELDYKRAYARIAAAAGVTKDQIVRIYGFESGGNGKYDVQAGLEYRSDARAISTALG